MINPTTKQLYEKMWQQKDEETAKAWIQGQNRSFYVPKLVFPPGGNGLSSSTNEECQWLYDMEGQVVLDLGTGCGVLAIAAALAGAKHVVATDINPDALEATRRNAEKHSVSDKIETFKSDLFQIVSGKFDRIIANLPIVDALVGSDYVSAALYDPDYRLRARLLREAKQYLNPSGRISFCHANLQSALTNDPFADFRRIEHLIDFYGYQIDVRFPNDAYRSIWIHYEIIPTPSPAQKIRNLLSWRFKWIEKLRDKRLRLQKKMEWNRKMRPYCVSRSSEDWDIAQEKFTKRISDTTRLINRLGG